MPAPPAECSSLPKLNPASQILSDYQGSPEQLLAKLNTSNADIEKISVGLNPAFKWGLAKLDSSSSSGDTLIPVPTCIVDTATLLLSSEINLSLSTYPVKLGVDQYLVYKYQLQAPNEPVSAVLSYQASDLAKTNSSLFSIAVIDELDIPEPVFYQSLGLCSKSMN